MAEDVEKLKQRWLPAKIFSIVMAAVRAGISFALSSCPAIYPSVKL
jgi:hypothetical protein